MMDPDLLVIDHPYSQDIAPNWKHLNYMLHLSFKTWGETALSASKGPPGAILIKNVMLATANKTGIAIKILLIKNR